MFSDDVCFVYQKGAVLPLITFGKCYVKDLRGMQDLRISDEAMEKLIEFDRGHALLYDPGHRSYMNALTKAVC